MLKKRLMSMGLALAMAVGLCTPALATETAEAQMEAEIQAMEDEIYADVYRQLEAQGAEDQMDAYVELLAPKIEANVYARYGVYEQNSAQSETYRYYAPNGGVVSYTQVGTMVEVLETYMDNETTAEFIKNEQSSFQVRQALAKDLKLTLKQLEAQLVGLLQWYQKPSTYLGILIAIDTIMSALPLERIRDAGGRALVINTYDPVEGIRVSIVMGWTKYPYIEVNTAQIRNIGYKVF